MANKNAIKTDRPTVTEYPVEETSRAIRREDWNRIKRLVDNIRPEPKFLRTAYSASFGVAVTAGVTIIPICYIPEKSPWLLPMLICSAVSALVLAIVFLCNDIHNTTSKSTDIKSLCKDMQDIEDTFKKETGEETEEERNNRINKALSAAASISSPMGISSVAKSVSASISGRISPKFKKP